MHPNKCPPREQLAVYISGELSNEAPEDLAAHIESCPGCQEMLATLDDAAADTFVSGLRVVAQNAFDGEPQCDEAVAQARALVGGPDRPARFPPADAPSSRDRRTNWASTNCWRN